MGKPHSTLIATTQGRGMHTHTNTHTHTHGVLPSYPSELAVDAVVAGVPHPAPNAVLRSVDTEVGTEVDAVSAAAATAHGEHVGAGGGRGGSARKETERGGENARGGHVVRGRGARTRGLGVAAGKWKEESGSAERRPW